MKRISLVLLINFVFFDSLFSQESPKYIPSVKVPPPSVMEMEKYTNYNVNIQNGVASFSIPIFNIKVGDLEIPLSLDYHASAVKYDFSTGELGLNWKLSDLGYVSRTLRGNVDEHFDKPNATELAKLNVENVEKEQFLGAIISDRDYSKYYDSQYDIFRYSTINNSGEFIIDNRSEKKIISTRPSDRITYNYQPSSRYIFDLSVVDNKGVTHYYGKNPSNSNDLYIAKPESGPEPVTWYTTRIEGTSKEFVNFSYEKRYETPYISATKGAISESLLIDVFGDFNTLQPITTPFSGFSLQTDYAIPITTYAVKEITTSDNQRIVFTRDQTDPRLLKKIEVYAVNNVLVKVVTLSYPTSGQNPALLGEVKIGNSPTDINPQIYKFTYNDQGRFIRKYDQMGYLNEAGMSQGQFPQFLNNTLYYNHIFSSYEGESWRQISLGELSFPMVNVPTLTRANDYYLLKEIQFPTGGKRTFEYEPHQYRKTLDNLNLVQSFGARIKRIYSSEPNSSVPSLVKQYTYGDVEDGMGNVFEDLSNEIYFFNEYPTLVVKPNSMFGTLTAVGRNLIVHSVNPYHNYLDQLGNIFYPKVTEYDQSVSISNNVVNYTNESKVEHAYVNSGGYSAISFFYTNEGSNSSPGGGYFNEATPNRMISNSFYRGYDPGFAINELSTSYYKKEGSAYSLIKKISNTYVNGNTTEKSELVVQPYYKTTEGHVPFITSTLYGTIKDNTHFRSIADYTSTIFQIKNASLLKKQITEDYTPTPVQSAVLTKEYTYNNIDLLTKEEIGDSKNNLISSNYSYAKDKSNQYLIGKNIIGIPLQNITTRKISTVTKTISNVINNYPSSQANADSYTSGLPLPTSIQSFDLQTGLPRTEVTFDKYDANGKILMFTDKALIPVIYLWGYKSQYPIAEIKNAVYSDVVTKLGGQAVLDQLNNISVTEALITEKMEALRTALPAAQITSFTYQPLIGMRSKTDPRGVTEYYEFDGMQRLKAVLDQFKNVTSSFDYHYRPN